MIRRGRMMVATGKKRATTMHLSKVVMGRGG